MIRASNSLDPDQARRFVGPDLGPTCLQRLSTDNTIGGKELIYSNSWSEFTLGYLLLTSVSFMAFWIKLTTYGECTRGFDKVSIFIFCACYIL